MIKDILKRGAISFAFSAFAGLMINLIIDFVANAAGAKDFCSISPDFMALFPTAALAAYVNILLYGLIGATFAVMTFIYEFERIGFVIQSIIYCLVTGGVCMLITILLWQLQRHPEAFVSTCLGYLAAHVIMIVVQYRALKKDISVINTELQH
ncbi:MAG: DUF3021 family protein [Lachnospiraceae bacterium]|nr:DUF3021 family protein [Lachnospiraceae bacterium]